MRQSIPKPPIPPPGQTPGHLTFWKNFGQIPRYIASLDGQMPRRLGLQRASNPPPSRHVEATVQAMVLQSTGKEKKKKRKRKAEVVLWYAFNTYEK